MLDQEVDRRLVQLDRPGASSEPTPAERIGQLLFEQRAHLGALERPKMTTWSMRLRNSGRNVRFSSLLDQLGAKAPVLGLEAQAGPVSDAEPTFEVRMMMLRRKSAVRPC